MSNIKQILSVFPPEREKALKNIYRYSFFDTMFYRPNLWIHSHRVAWLVQEISSYAKKVFPSLDEKELLILALVHDDAEIITGDIQAAYKVRMTDEEKEEMSKNEEEAIEKLSKRFPSKIEGYEYKSLLFQALNKNTPASQVVSFVDKVDALCESLHEVYGGNISLLRSVMFYMKILSKFDLKFPDLKVFLEIKDIPLINLDARIDSEKSESKYSAHLGKPHTPESIKMPTELCFYNMWREITLENWGEEGIRVLTEQKEFLR